MGGVRNVARIWAICGAAVIVVLALAGWFLVIGPKFTEADGVRRQADDTRMQLVSLRRKIAGLDEQQAQLPAYRAALKANRAALPTDSGVPDFLRQLQSSGELTGVAVSGFSAATPVQAVGLADVWQIDMTLNAQGAPDGLSKFLDRLQTEQPRAVLVQSINLTEDVSESSGSSPAGGSSGGGRTTLNLSLTAFVAPPTGTTPIITTK